jgi:hypothetical protein
LVPGSYHIVGSVRAADGVSYLMQPQVIAVFLVEEDMAAYEWRAPNARAFLPEAAPVAVPYEWRFGGDLEGGGSSPPSAVGEDPL